MHMHSIPMWVGTGDNYAYLIVDEHSRDAVIIDPASPDEVVPMLKGAIESGQINLKAIVNTHHHRDHSGGNVSVREQLGLPDLPIIGGKDCAAVTRIPPDGDVFKLGTISLKSIYTPCHTQDSICWFVEDNDDRLVFTGDTLFHGGCGRFFEGTGPEMHKALNVTLAALPDDTLVFPGHEYTKDNARFGMSVLPSEAIRKLLDFSIAHTETQGHFTIADEKAHNVFMRVDDPIVQRATGETEPGAVMAKLREMKNKFR